MVTPSESGTGDVGLTSELLLGMFCVTISGRIRKNELIHSNARCQVQGWSLSPGTERNTAVSMRGRERNYDGAKSTEVFAILSVVRLDGFLIGIASERPEVREIRT